mmetsp:Transcript_42786/g.124388  ORF Transcript_42786/g.124388 Transcript_42786/m.124388 type:complete len:401 (+) Transcript_42786:1355-2557(+)
MTRPGVVAAVVGCGSSFVSCPGATAPCAGCGCVCGCTGRKPPDCFGNKAPAEPSAGVVAAGAATGAPCNANLVAARISSSRESFTTRPIAGAGAVKATAGTTPFGMATTKPGGSGGKGAGAASAAGLKGAEPADAETGALGSAAATFGGGAIEGGPRSSPGGAEPFGKAAVGGKEPGPAAADFALEPRTPSQVPSDTEAAVPEGPEAFGRGKGRGAFIASCGWSTGCVGGCDFDGSCVVPALAAAQPPAPLLFGATPAVLAPDGEALVAAPEALPAAAEPRFGQYFSMCNGSIRASPSCPQPNGQSVVRLGHSEAMCALSLASGTSSPQFSKHGIVRWLHSPLMCSSMRRTSTSMPHPFGHFIRLLVQDSALCSSMRSASTSRPHPRGHFMRRLGQWEAM